MKLISVCLENIPLLLKQLRPWVPNSSTFALHLQIWGIQRLQPNLKPIQTWKEVLSKRVPILGEGVACNQDPDSLHCKALNESSL
jgi:hypothetical protein